MKDNIVIMKVGGSCLTNADALGKLLKILKNYEDSSIILVASAFSGVTDKLIDLAQAATRDVKEYKERLEEIRKFHEKMNEMLFGEEIIHFENTSDFINVSIRTLEEICEQIVDYGLEKFRLDYAMSFGEKLSTFFLAEYLSMNSMESAYIPGDQLIVTDNRFGNALPLMDFTNRKVKRLVLPILERGAIPCITGFIGFNKSGYTTTLGRGGSDYTGSIIAFSLAELKPDARIRVILWKNVDGILTASPKMVASPKLIESMTYAEAKEISFFGAKVLHPKCIYPLEEKGIPLEIRNFDKPLDTPFTLISGEGDPGRIISGISIVQDIALLTAKSSSLVAVPGTLANIFSILGGNNINISLVSQSSSEVNTTFCIKEEDGEKALSLLENSPLFQNWFEFELRKDVVVLGVIGKIANRGVKGKIFSRLDERGIEVLAVAQSADGLNVSLVLKEEDVKVAVNALHDEFDF